MFKIILLCLVFLSLVSAESNVHERSLRSPRIAYTKVSSPSDCAPRDTTTSEECQIKAKKCEDRFNIPMEYYYSSCPGGGKKGCQCGVDRCDNASRPYCPSSTPSVSPTTSASPTLQPTTASPTLRPTSCFHGKGVVQLENGESVTLEQLHFGDKVLVGDGSYEEVLEFSTAAINSTVMAYNVVLENGRELGVSTFHLVFVSDDQFSSPVDIHARSVKPGQFMWVQNDKTKSLEAVRVSAVETKEMTGFFTPKTVQGTIVVNGILASCHTQVSHALNKVLYWPLLKYLSYFPYPSGTLPKQNWIPYSQFLQQPLTRMLVSWTIEPIVNGVSW